MSHRATMTAQQATEKVRSLNLQINQQLKRAGILDHKGKIIKTLESQPESEWKLWIQDVISVRDFLINEYQIN